MHKLYFIVLVFLFWNKYSAGLSIELHNESGQELINYFGNENGYIPVSNAHIVKQGTSVKFEPIYLKYRKGKNGEQNPLLRTADRMEFITIKLTPTKSIFLVEHRCLIVGGSIDNLSVVVKNDMGIGCHEGSLGTALIYLLNSSNDELVACNPATIDDQILEKEGEYIVSPGKNVTFNIHNIMKFVDSDDLVTLLKNPKTKADIKCSLLGYPGPYEIRIFVSFPFERIIYEKFINCQNLDHSLGTYKVTENLGLKKIR